MRAFSLSKWYLDYVTESGEVTIAYTGDARWGPMRVRYASLLEAAGTSVRQRHSLRAYAQPRETGSGISWYSELLKSECAWDRVAPSVKETVYNSKVGSIEWNCLIPLARAKSGERIGLGYVEHLRMTIPPWKLPIRTLRWGRFTSACDYLTWIDWQGDYSRRVVYMNGEVLPCSRIEDGRLLGEDGTQLSMDRSLVLRDGPLGSTVFSGIPVVRNTFPVRLLQIQECKWRSWSRLERKGGPAVEGWAIHEKVSWPS